MNNFELFCPTRVVFGKGSIAKLPQLIDKSKKILLTVVALLKRMEFMIRSKKHWKDIMF